MVNSDGVLPKSETEASEVRRDGRAGASFLTRIFKAFRHRDFRLLWMGAFTSTTGTWIQIVALSWLVLALTDSAFYLGFTGFLGELPILLFTLLGGVIADRFDRRKLLLASQYVQMSCAFTLATLVLLEAVHISHLLTLVFVAGTAQAFGGPAYQALVPGLVDREDVPNAIALNSIQFNLARVVGPVLAGAALATVGAAACFALNGLSFLAVIVSLYLIRASFRPARTKESVLTGFRNGVRYVREQGALWQLSVLGFVSTFTGIPVITLLPLYARDVFGMDATGYSTLMAVSGAGAITGALGYAALSHLGGRGRLALRIQLISALLVGVFAVSTDLLLSYAALFLGGACLIILFASVTSLVQMATSEEMRGRVISIFMLAFRGGMPLGNLTAGLVASATSPSLALLLGSFLLALTSAGFLLSGSGVKKL